MWPFPESLDFFGFAAELTSPRFAKNAKGWATRHPACVTGTEGIVEIESEWTARRRERMGLAPKLPVEKNPRPSKARVGAPSRVIMTEKLGPATRRVAAGSCFVRGGGGTTNGNNIVG